MPFAKGSKVSHHVRSAVKAAGMRRRKALERREGKEATKDQT